MGVTVALMLLMTATGMAQATSFDRPAAVQECVTQWGDANPQYESCLSDLEPQWRRLVALEAGLDRDRVTAAEQESCARCFQTRYLDQARCLEDANACHYRDLHGRQPIEEYCP